MQVDKIRQILRKIQALTDNMEEQGETSSLERDLLLRYLRDVYEMVLNPNVADKVAVKPKSVVEAPAPVEPARVQPVVEVKQEISKPEEVEATGSDVPVNTQPMVTHDTSENHSPVMKQFTDSTKYFPPESEETKPNPQVDTARAEQRSATQVEVVEMDENLMALFEIKASDDLAGRLQNQPITSIETALGLNERLLTINTLFGGNPHNFNEALKSIQSMSSFEEARDHLIRKYATEFQWAANDKKQKATEFAQLVRRKFA